MGIEYSLEQEGFEVKVIDAGTVDLKKELISVKGLVDKAVEPLHIPMELKE